MLVVIDVAVVRWPTERDQRARFEGTSAPRLLLVEEGASPPAGDDCLEDWVRLPATDVDVRLRIEALARRASRHLSSPPVLDGDGVLWFGGDWVSLPPVEARLVGSLVGRFGALVSRDGMSRSGWPDGAPRRNALDVHVLRLRRRLHPLGLVIRTIRSRGYLLEVDARLHH